jgi:hypothetical protein
MKHPILKYLSSLILFGLFLAGCYSSGAQTAHTPIPTLVRATLPVLSPQKEARAIQGECKIAALDLIGAWVQAGKPQSDPFDFKSADGKDCQGDFAADVQPLFNQPNLWFPGALACSACHGPDLQKSAAKMDLSTYEGILAGSRRSSPNAAGQDILAGPWEKSRLYTMLFTRQMPIGRPPDSPAKGPEISAGKAK